MHILLSNDDGYQSPGIQVLAKYLRQMADVTVVAPVRDRSASSNSLTVDRPLNVTEVASGVYAVDGTPTDCVHLAVTGLLQDKSPDMVVAGINHGENLGDDVVYSGTVAAAMEGRHLGLPAVAISVAASEPQYIEVAAELTQRFVSKIDCGLFPAEIILNINIPDLPLQQLQGFKATRLGKRHVAEPVIESVDPRGKKIYWVGPPGGEQDAGDGTDFHAVSCNYVSVTPLHTDLTRHQVIDNVAQWLKQI